MRNITTLIAITFLMIGCSSMDITQYKDKKPTLVLEDYFSGDLKAYGVFQDRFGNVKRQFDVDIKGTWDKGNQKLTLVEDFVYDDGQTEQRIWTIHKTDNNQYEGTADGTVGKATGETAGNAFFWAYTFDLPYNGKKLRVDFDDRMWLQDERILFNKAVIKKFGITLGDVYIFFEKKS